MPEGSRGAHRLGRRHGTSESDTAGGGSATRRVPAVLAVTALLVAGAIAERGSATPVGVRSGPEVIPGPANPVVASSAALSSSWFCADAPTTSADPAEGSLEAVNSTGTAISGTVQLLSSNGSHSTVPIVLAPRSRLAIPEPSQRGSAIGAIANFDGGGVAVEQLQSSHDGLSVAPCATRGSTAWYFATGTTLRDAEVSLSLLNPYPTPAIVDLSFSTEQGVEQPADFQGIVVPADSVAEVNLGAHLRRRFRIATTVSARAGRVIAFKTQTIVAPAAGDHIVGNVAPSPGDPNDPVPPVAGLSLVLGAPAPSTGWTWPDGLASAATEERFEIYNPSARSAVLKLSFHLDEGAADPVGIVLAPRATTTVYTNVESRVPLGDGHSALLRSVNGVAVVAERTVTNTLAGKQGFAELMGGATPADSWLFAGGNPSAAQSETLEVFNGGVRPSRVTVMALHPGKATAVSQLTIAPGRRASMAIDALQQGNDPLMVTATHAVVAEQDLYNIGAPGLAPGLGVPFS